jgi:hypothetical protein
MYHVNVLCILIIGFLSVKLVSVKYSKGATEEVGKVIFLKTSAKHGIERPNANTLR